MRLPFGLLVASVVAGLLSAAAALLARPAAALQFGLAMLLALLGYVLLGRGARRVRWAIAAGVGLLAVVAAMRLHWYQEQVVEVGWLTYGPAAAEPSSLGPWRDSVDRQRLAALGSALGAACLAAGVLALPSRDRRRGVATTLFALLLLAWFGLGATPEFVDYPLPDLLGTVWPALLAALVTLGALALSGWRADRRWLLPVGLFLLSLAAADAYSVLAGVWSGWWEMANPDRNAFLELGMAVSTSTKDPLQLSSAVETTIPLAGAALAAAGALRSSRETTDRMGFPLMDDEGRDTVDGDDDNTSSA
ncbi:aminopeptidase [Micromonospora tarensis]|uniref:Aminopeptidase n=1 Tax=Micromonospora tarensis TaxID=2806100 RepID=A0ABS1YCI9_9ACTN|nr:aminopeptidase [Micromonospora tarensis]MBM0275067.1 aminopeptidase [Micromonospora tarensis]